VYLKALLRKQRIKERRKFMNEMGIEGEGR
jgi:hypothetical protein